MCGLLLSSLQWDVVCNKLQNVSLVLSITNYIQASFTYLTASILVVIIFLVDRSGRNGNALESKQLLKIVHSQNRIRFEISLRYG